LLLAVHLNKGRSDIYLHLLNVTLDMTTDMIDGFQPLYLGKPNTETGPRAKATAKIQFNSIYFREETISVQQVVSTAGWEISTSNAKQIPGPILRNYKHAKLLMSECLQ
jgi:hypothetical protein